MLALLLLQPERSWTLQQLAEALQAPVSSVHRELGRAEDAGILVRDSSGRPHRFQAASEDPFFDPLVALLRGSVGLEEELRAVLSDRDDVLAAVIHGSWAAGSRRPDSDIDVLVVGNVELADLRRQLRPIGKAAGRTIDLTVLAPYEFNRMLQTGSSFARQLTDGQTIALVGDLDSIASR
jgi:predicted nucleotidyltransferase